MDLSVSTFTLMLFYAFKKYIVFLDTRYVINTITYMFSEAKVTQNFYIANNPTKNLECI